jgi:O-acetyl-ADP-ribose deacetylase (regulator of RNase III)
MGELHMSEVVKGDLLDQKVDAIVNSWNRNVIPWWLLLPQGVSGAIKRKAGLQPFRELNQHGLLPLGGAVLTSAGRLPFKGIIHVAGINLLWRATEVSIRESVRNAMKIVREQAYQSVALPIIGSGSGGFSQARAKELMIDELSQIAFLPRVLIVEYQRKTS